MRCTACTAVHGWFEGSRRTLVNVVHRPRQEGGWPAVWTRSFVRCSYGLAAGLTGLERTAEASVSDLRRKRRHVNLDSLVCAVRHRDNAIFQEEDQRLEAGVLGAQVVRLLYKRHALRLRMSNRALGRATLHTQV